MTDCHELIVHLMIYLGCLFSEVNLREILHVGVQLYHLFHPYMSYLKVLVFNAIGQPGDLEYISAPLQINSLYHGL